MKTKENKYDRCSWFFNIPFKISQLITRINRDDVEYSELVKILYLLIIEWYPNFIYIKYKESELETIVEEIVKIIKEVKFYDQKENSNEDYSYTKKRK